MSWEYTANAGSRAAEWIANSYPPAVGGGYDATRPRMLDALMASLDADPPAGLLFLVIGGNDFNFECAKGLGDKSQAGWTKTFDGIQANIQTLVNLARQGRPHLHVVVVGYDFFHFEFLLAFGLALDGFDRLKYNLGLFELGVRQWMVAGQNPGTVYAHNMGLLQHLFGDGIHPPFPVPNPLPVYGCLPYSPGDKPAPGKAPGYQPFPGGDVNCPAPLDVMPDGIHPSPQGFRMIVENTLDQGPAAWISGGEFP
jgi:hypothetical protein